MIERKKGDGWKEKRISKGSEERMIREGPLDPLPQHPPAIDVPTRGQQRLRVR